VCLRLESVRRHYLRPCSLRKFVRPVEVPLGPRIDSYVRNRAHDNERSSMGLCKFSDTWLLNLQVRQDVEKCGFVVRNYPVVSRYFL
jgi:hypothetical protein